MSKIKNPQHKKRKSLVKDCRNIYGEKDKSSRKAIPKNKALRHQQQRHTSHQTLSQIDMTMKDDNIETLVTQAVTQSKAKSLAGFKKWADTPLGEVIRRQKQWQAYLANG